MAQFWARMGGVTISEEMVLLEAKLGSARDLIESLARRKAAAAIAWERGVGVSEREVEEALANFYADRMLHDPEEIRAWRARMHLKEEAIRSYLREEKLIERVRARLVPDAAVEARFKERQSDYRQADIEVFAFSNEEAARDFLAAVQTGEIMARLGEPRRVTRSLVPREVADDFAAASEGDFIGPVATRARTCQIFRLVRWHELQLDATLKESIREELFREALAPIVSSAPLAFLS